MTLESKHPQVALIQRAARHTPAVLTFGLLAIWSTFPLVLRLDSSIPGTGAGDNVSYLWNLWWFKYAIAHQPSAYFYTPMLFAPFGTQLVLHTHTTLPSLLAFLLLPVAPLAASHNIVLIAGLAANGLCMYALAFYLVRRVVPSIAAGVLFAASGFVQVHLLGHFNLTHAWVIPLVALSFVWFVGSPSRGKAAVLALSGATLTYTDYYYTLYCLAFAVIWVIHRSVHVRAELSPRRYPRVAAICVILLLADVFLICAIAATGGGGFEVGGHSVSLRTVRNPLTFFWFFLACWVISRRPLRISIHRRVGVSASPSITLWLMVLMLYGMMVAPIIAAAIHLITSGEYVTQRVFWRSSPPGIDLATVFLGHPRHFVSGTWTEAAYGSLGIGFEQVAWCGLMPLVLVFGFREWRRAPAARVWIVAGIVFFTLSLGPFLRVAGFDTALPLPWAALRYVPVLSNARIPGRAFIMVQLSICVLTAFTLALNGRRRHLVATLPTLMLLEAVPSPVPLYVLPPPDAVDIELAADARAGAVAELPTGLRDGFGELGSFDHRAMVHQIAHERPLVGGFVARLSGSVRDRYLAAPFFQQLLSISAATGRPDPGGSKTLASDAVDQAAKLGIRYLVINRDKFLDEGELLRVTLERAGFHYMAGTGIRELYSIGPLNSSGRVRLSTEGAKSAAPSEVFAAKAQSWSGYFYYSHSLDAPNWTDAMYLRCQRSMGTNSAF